MKRSLLVAILTLLGAASCVNAADEGAAFKAGGTANDEDTDSANGSLRVAAGKPHGDVATVNGAIRVEDDASATAARTVNGDIRVGARAQVRSLHSVNGGITLAPGAHVAESVTTVNGALTMQDDAQVSGAVSNVNGDIVLTSAHIGGGITTVNGNINLQRNTRVEGGIWVQRKGSSGWFNREGDGPRIVIGPGARVQGELRFEHKVQLYVSDRASIGPVTGATAIRYAGENPPG